MRPFTALFAILAILAILACAGCNLGKGSGGSSSIPGTGTTLPVDYSQAVNDEAGSTGSSAALVGRVTQAVSEVVLGSAGASTAPAAAPALERIGGSGSMVIDLATLSAGGRLLFPDATGSVTAAWTGTVVTSWPVGTSAVAAADVTLTLGQVVVTSAGGSTFTIPAGAIAMRLEATAAVTDSANWVLTCTTTTAIPSAAPVTGTLVRAGKTSTLSVHGQRQATWVVTRVRTPDPLNPGGYLIDRRDVAVTVGGPASVGSAGGFSTWTLSRGSLPVVWNRKAQVSWREDLLSPVAVPPVTVAQDTTYISATIMGFTVRIGPFSAYEMAARFKLAAADQGLLAAYL